MHAPDSTPFDGVKEGFTFGAVVAINRSEMTVRRRVRDLEKSKWIVSSLFGVRRNWTRPRRKSENALLQYVAMAMCPILRTPRKSSLPTPHATTKRLRY